MSSRIKFATLSLEFGEENSLRSIIAALVESRMTVNDVPTYDITSIKPAGKTMFDPLGIGGEIVVQFHSFEGAEQFLQALRKNKPGNAA